MRLAKNAVPRSLCLAVRLALGAVDGSTKFKH